MADDDRQESRPTRSPTIFTAATSFMCMPTIPTTITTTISTTTTARSRIIRCGGRTTSTLTTVGIDIGSSGTQVIFSRVHLRRLAEDLTSRYYVVSRETLFQSPVALTPYQSEERIDDQKLGVIIDDAYVAAGLSPDQIDTGVVILTGEALRRDNAQGIAEILSEQGGEFVTATAGHHMEAMLAAYGSGAARVSSDERQAHPQYRHRRRHHQARPGRERQSDRHRRRAYRRPPASRRGRQDRSARSGRETSRQARRLFLEPRRCRHAPPTSTKSPTAWPMRSLPP